MWEESTTEERRKQDMNNSKYRVLVFGGARGMGLWIAGFFARFGHKVTIVDTYERTPSIAAAKGFRGVIFKDGDLTPLLTDDGYLDCHVAMIAVPIDVTPNVIQQVGPRLRPGFLLMDITSLKSPAMQAMDKAAGPTVGVLGTHPMFGPNISSFFGQTCVIIPSQTHPPGHWLAWWVHMLEQEGALYVESTTDEHDKIMVIIQVLLHYVIISFGAAISMSGLDLSRVNSFKSPLYEIMMGLVARIYSSNPQLYYMIQKHPDGKAVRNLFRKSTTKISEVFERDTLVEYEGFNSAHNTKPQTQREEMNGFD